LVLWYFKQCVLMFIVCMLDYFFKVMEQFWKQVQLVYKYLIPLFEGKNFFEFFFFRVVRTISKSKVMYVHKCLVGNSIICQVHGCKTAFEIQILPLAHKIYVGFNFTNPPSKQQKTYIYIYIMLFCTSQEDSKAPHTHIKS
jgi:hypothetical protein